MYNLLAKKGQLFAILLGVVAVVIFLGTVIGGLGSSGYSLSDDLNQIMKNNPDQTFNFFNPGLAITLALIVIGAVVAVLFGLYQLVSAPKNSLKLIVSLAVIAVLFFALYSTSSSDFDSPIGATLMRFAETGVTENVSKVISGGLMTTLILAGIAIVGMLLFEIYNIFK